MIVVTWFRHKLILASMFVLAACAHHGPAPITNLDARSCVTAPELGTAGSLSFTGQKEIKVVLDRSAPCLQREDGQRSAYAAFHLPEAEQPYLLTVTSDLQEHTLFAPRVILLDAEGATLRELTRDSFLFHGSSLYVGIRAAPIERYVVVASDPGAVGRQESQVVDGVTQNTTTFVSGSVVVSSTYYQGYEVNRAFTYAHNGSVTIAVKPMPRVSPTESPPRNAY